MGSNPTPSANFQNIESGTIQNPTIDTLSKIAKALDVKIDDLIK
ncbi:MAG: helix-turn-helix transcriptional regulator [bacterium]|nr:helix-turn-helix transcriptional regulator [bacterium]